MWGKKAILNLVFGQNQQTLKHFLKSDLQEMTELVELLRLWDVKTKPMVRILLVNTSYFFFCTSIYMQRSKGSDSFSEHRACKRDAERRNQFTEVIKADCYFESPQPVVYSDSSRKSDC